MRQAIFTILIILIPLMVHSQNVSDFLIQSDIGNYKRITKGGASGDILAGADHFSEDHQDESYGISYHNKQTRLWVEVQVTQHAGSDSDKWLLHEVEDGYRDGEIERLGLLTKGARLRDISGNKIISLRGSGYSWISNYVVIEISYTDLAGTKPEPLEIVQAYLQKFPSTISSTLVLDQTHSIQWIKDEMERRLWLCDKWFTALQQGKAEMKDVLQNTVNSMNVFLDYREKYYGIKAQDEKLTLQNALAQNNGTAIKNKLTEYKNWWLQNKNAAISI